MKIALVWNHRSRLLDCSFRFEQYLEGFRALGHDPVVVCDRDSAADFTGPLEVVETAQEFAQPELWQRIAARVAVIVTWHRMADVLSALQAAGTRTIAITDTDGQLSLRQYPWRGLERLMVYQEGLADRLRGLKFWGGQWIRSVRGKSAEDLEAIASTRASDIVIFGHDRGQQSFGKFLAGSGEAELARKLAAVPFTIGASFLSCPIPQVKDDRIVAIGRWNDPQKHAELLAASIDRFLSAKRQRQTEVVIFGRGGDVAFEALGGRHSAVRIAGVQPQEVVARTLASARAIVFSSRWEGSPHSALEALALGATLIGPPIPSLASWSQAGRYGTISRSRRPASLAQALNDEMVAWQSGRRDPLAISTQWREQLAPEAVCQRMLEALP